MKALKKRVFMEPIIAVELVLVVLLAGAGVAFAVTVNSIGDTDLWPGEATVTNAPDLSVTDYELNYNPELTAVISIDIELTNSDGGNPHICDVYVAAGNTGLTVIEDGTEASWTVGAGATDTKTITLSNPVDLDDQDFMNVIVDQTS